MKIAICPDSYGENDASSPVWSKIIKELGHEVKIVDVYKPDILEQLIGCDGFMWRWGHGKGMSRIALRLLPVIENYLKIPVYPNNQTAWHYNDKIIQSYIFEALKLPAPKSTVYFNQQLALKDLSEGKFNFPIVIKLSNGAGSTNVQLLNNENSAIKWVNRLFKWRHLSLDENNYSIKSYVYGILKGFLRGGKQLDNGIEFQSGYILLQEFLPKNDFDIRVTVIGNKAFAYRRFNRKNDFRASGSGNFDTNPKEINISAVKLAFESAKKVNAQSVAFDILEKENQFFIIEMSYTYVSWMVHACPGYWDSNLNWHEGQHWPEEFQINDFFKLLNTKQTK